MKKAVVQPIVIDVKPVADAIQEVAHRFPKPLFNRREEVWLRAWLACTASSNCQSKDAADSWANHCLSKFEQKFPNA